MAIPKNEFELNQLEYMEQNIKLAPKKWEEVWNDLISGLNARDLLIAEARRLLEQSLSGFEYEILGSAISQSWDWVVFEIHLIPPKVASYRTVMRCSTRENNRFETRPKFHRDSIQTTLEKWGAA